MSDISKVTRATPHVSKIVQPPKYALLADMRPPIEGEMKACLTLILNTIGIIPTPNELNTIIMGSKDLCETKRNMVYSNVPCADCRLRFHIREIHVGHRA